MDFNDSSDDSSFDCDMDNPSLYLQIVSTIIFVIVWPFIVFDMKCFPIGRPAAALIGAVLMVLFQILTQDEVYEIEGEPDNLQTLFLLVGMMMLSYYFDREGLLRIVSLWIFGKDKPLKHILWKVCLLSAAMSAFVTNDATCVVLTPLLLTEFVKQGRNRKELLPLCVGIATSANIGSAATVFGNPQNAFIAASANVSLIHFIIAELPAAIFGVLLSIGLLYAFFFKSIFCKSKNQEPEEPQSRVLPRIIHKESASLHEERERTAQTLDQSSNPLQSSQIAQEHELLNSGEVQSLKQPLTKSCSLYNISTHQHSHSAVCAIPHSKSDSDLRHLNYGASTNNSASLTVAGSTVIAELQEKDIEIIRSVNNSLPAVKHTIRGKIFVVWLILISVVLVVLLAIPPPPTVPVNFNLGCIPMAAAILTMLVDTIINRKYANDVIQKIDWTVILMFMGLFVWLEGFRRTCFTFKLFNVLKPYMNLKKIQGVLLFSVFIIVGSNIFSNVPLVILIIDHIDELCGNERCEGPLGGLLLAWISTIAGNFTLIGSVANLLVAEKARTSAKYNLTFWAHLRFGFVSTLIVIYTSLPIVYFLGLVAGLIGGAN